MYKYQTVPIDNQTPKGVIKHEMKKICKALGIDIIEATTVQDIINRLLAEDHAKKYTANGIVFCYGRDK